jgi:hypothetical protein
VRIPISKVYRSFPELDRFSDEDCERFVALAREARPGASTAVAALCMLVVLGGLLVGGVIGVPVYQSIVGPHEDGTWRSAVGLLAWVGLALGGPLIGFTIRDRWVRTLVASRVRQGACLHCRYSLLGLTPQRGVVRCPECGEENDLSERGLSGEDLLAGRAME